ncbi:MAG: 50S ribosomal protein L31 [Parcubacteria group bacterium]|nr:50S ribosomal protein L31 [Parcubacteria group bacterium]
MKKNIHPTYYEDATVTCSCGNVMNIGSTVKEIHTEICIKCHPLFTGQQKLIDTAGRLERYRKIVEKSATKKSAKKSTKKTSKK